MIKKPIASLINKESDKKELYAGIFLNKIDKMNLDRDNHRIDRVKTRARIYPYLFLSGI